MIIILPDTIRIKKNSKRIYARGRFKTVLPSKAYVIWEKQARLVFCAQHPGFKPVSYLLHVRVAAYYKGQQPDLSGVLESVGDCLQGFVWQDDRQIKSWDGSRLHHELDNPRTEIIVSPFIDVKMAENQPDRHVAAPK